MPPTSLSLVHAPGNIDSLRFEEKALPKLGPDDVQLRVHTAGLNFRDVLLVYMGFAPLSLPPGVECSGVVEEVGQKVRDFKPGDEVAAFSLGQLATRAVVPARDVVKRPDSMTLGEAGCFPSSFGTAHLALNRLAQLKQGERVLIHCAAGGVGIAAVQMAKRVGAEIFATAGNEEKQGWLRSQGVDHVYHSRTFDFVEQIRADTKGEGVDVVLNSLSGESVAHSLGLLRWGGRFMEIGKKDFIENSQLPLGPFIKALTYYAVDIAEMILRDRGASIVLREVREQFQQGALSVKPIKLFPSTEVSTAFRYMAGSKHIGRVGISFLP